LDHAGNDKLLNQLLLSLGCWLMLARRFCVFNAGLKVDAAREILTVIMTSNHETLAHVKDTHTVVRRVFCFWRSFCPFLASRLTTVSFETCQLYAYSMTCEWRISQHWFGVNRDQVIEHFLKVCTVQKKILATLQVQGKVINQTILWCCCWNCKRELCK